MSELNESLYKKRGPRRTKQIPIGFTDQEVAALAAISARTGKSRSEIVRRAVDDMITREGGWHQS